jgi:hypothetical protein
MQRFEKYLVLGRVWNSRRGREMFLCVGVNDGASSTGILDVFYANRNALTDDLFHGEWVYYFTAIIGQFCSFLWRNSRKESCGADFSWIGSEDTVYLLPDLQL